MSQHKKLSAMKDSLIEKAQRRLTLNLPNYEYDTDLLGDYFDDAVSIIKNWKKNQEDEFLLDGSFDANIVRFIVESIGTNGMEGQSSNSTNGSKKIFIATPEDNLKASIPQAL